MAPEHSVPLRDHLERLICEQDRRYQQQFSDAATAVAAALAAQEKLVAAAFLSNETAIQKSEANADRWRIAANEWRSAMNDREIKFATRSETDHQIESLQKQIVELQRGESRDEGGVKAHAAQRAQTMVIVTLVVTITIAIATTVGSLIFYLATRNPVVKIPL